LRERLGLTKLAEARGREVPPGSKRAIVLAAAASCIFGLTWRTGVAVRRTGGRLRRGCAVPLVPQAGVGWVSVRWFGNLALGVAAITLAGCGGSPGRGGPPPSGGWVVFGHLPGVVDLAGPRSDGSFLVAAAGGCWSWDATAR
jgi:hypothetical protein